MSKASITKLLSNFSKLTRKHRAEILTGLGIAGMVTTAIFVGTATPKALELLRSENEELETNDEQPLTKLESVKTVWKCYIPAFLMCVASIMCILGANTVHARRTAALSAAYTLSESTLKEYRNKVVETLGAKKEKELRREIATEKVLRNPVINREIYDTGKGHTLCYDVLRDEYFWSDIERIRKAVNDLNEIILDDMIIGLNDFYYEIGLKPTPLGESVGWNINRGGKIELSFGSCLSHDNIPCLVIDYANPPKYEFDKY